MSILIDPLEAQRGRWAGLTSTMDITDTEEFGEDVRQLGASHSCAPLQQWDETLTNSSRDFDITGVQRMIGEFPAAIDQLRSWGHG
ncbi:MAG TPA: hypothetical protein QF604_14985 [Candidatus Latescibacteria bacterium]|nr:hypothetical protein [Gemmatimonadota bacterium]MDP7364013.1 hypothetical protein [Candidatus Latescibacterota bacterium]MDP7632053.1 hypothetical protein [Candidatus Latescibacterota bacterium]HCV25837.1 hypothetical protein [Candidatus Latescibacterota bacterium]HJN29216.1 hypothetical protein [Candidatus Latescibacterota bacterium]